MTWWSAVHNEQMYALLSVVAVAQVSVGIFYLFRTWSGRVRPHAVSWFVWTLLNVDAASIQRANTPGAGFFVSLVAATTTFAIFLSALLRGERHLTRSDVICLVGAITAGVLWALVDQPLGSAVCITAVDAFASFPTFRKSYERPRQESIAIYGVSACSYSTAIATLGSFDLASVMFPAFVVLSDSCLVALICARRWALQGKTQLSKDAEQVV